MYGSALAFARLRDSYPLFAGFGVQAVLLPHDVPNNVAACAAALAFVALAASWMRAATKVNPLDAVRSDV